MDRFRRIQEVMSRLQKAEGPIPTRRLLDELECSRHSLYRAIDAARMDLGAPILFDPSARGWKFDPTAKPFELPALWFTAHEVLLLLSLHHILQKLTPGLLQDGLESFRARLTRLLEDEHLGAAGLLERMKFLPVVERKAPAEALRTCMEALLRSRRLSFLYEGRARAQVTQRVVSPQQLVHYRENWYLDAWCHTAKALRTFSLDRIREAALQSTPAKRLSEKTLQRHFGDAFGIFAGPATHTAVLRFTPERARWVADERWHPQQQGRFLDDGRYELKIPYGDPRELLLDILRHGPEVEVLAPKSLCAAVQTALKAALDQYEKQPGHL